jgi:ferritin-like metal-binding protein YciE
MAELSVADAKLVQYLNEAYGTELRLETALQAHIAMTTRAPYRKRLKEHLSETKRHAREVKKAIKRLGGALEPVSTPGPQPIADVAQAVVGGAQKAAALAQGPLHALRGTGEDEKQLKNAKTEYASESEEIATYTAIEALAGALDDKETQLLARSILRDEVRMRSFLEKEIPRLTKAVVKAEIPSSARATGRKAKPSAAAKGKKAATKRKAAAKPAASRKAVASRKATTPRKAAKRTPTRRTASTA